VVTPLPNCELCHRSPWAHTLRGRKLSCFKSTDAFPAWVVYEVLLAIGKPIPRDWKQKPPKRLTP
jgi:hypothetical protein